MFSFLSVDSKCHLETNVTLFYILMVFVSCIGKPIWEMGCGGGEVITPVMISLEIIYS